MKKYDDLILAVTKGDRPNVKELIEFYLKNSESPEHLIDNGLILGMEEAGNLWQNGKYFIPQVLLAARAMNYGMDILEPLITKAQNNAQTIIIGSVEGDLHDIGKNLVIIMLKSKGFNVVDLKTDVKAQTFVEAIIKYQPKVVALSALLSTTMLKMKDVIEAIKNANLRDKVLIACGGAPVTEEFTKSIGADIYKKDAVGFANYLKKLFFE